MHTEETIQKIKSNTDFALGAVIDNNFEALKSALANEGILIQDKQGALIQMRILANANKQKLANTLAKVPFIEKPDHYTSGLDITAVKMYNPNSAKQSCTGNNCKCK